MAHQIYASLSLEDLPEDLLHYIVTMVASASPQDFANSRLAAKCLNFGLADPTICATMKLTPFVNNPSRATSFPSLIASCLKVDNLDAHFINGMLEFFYRKNKFLGMHHLEVAAKNGHPEGGFVFAMMLMLLGRIPKGKKLFNQMVETHGTMTVERCWVTTNSSFAAFDHSMKKVYETSYALMQPPLDCHPDEINTVCNKCIHAFFVSEVFETMIGLRPITTRS